MYKEDASFRERRNESQRVTAKYRDRVPIIIERKGSDTPVLSKRKFLVPNDLLCSQLFYVIRKKLRMAPESALFFCYDNNTMVSGTTPAHEAFQRHSDADGFLYMFFSVENTFGALLPPRPPPSCASLNQVSNSTNF